MTEKTPIDWSSGWIELDDVEPAAANKGKAANGKAAARSFPFVDTTRWRSEEPPEREWAVPDRIPLRQVALFSGEGAAGKSTILLHECAAHPLDREWLGVMPTPGPTFFIDAEDDQNEVWRRLAAIARHYGGTIAEILDRGFRVATLFGDDALLATVSKGGTMTPTRLYHSLREAAGDIKPIMIGIASAACVFAGEESNRSQVQQFVGLLTKIAIIANGSVQLVSHPSLTGVTSGTGLSGSTQWHNAVRARAYLKGVKAEDGELVDNDLREIVFKKNQYGPLSESIVLRYQNGLYLPIAGASLDQAAKAAIAEDVFLALLKRYRNENRNASTNVSKTYAPALFAREDEAKAAGVGKTDLETAMRELFRAGKIWNEPFDKPSRERYRLAIK
jgi:RecA-family ATPase